MPITASYLSYVLDQLSGLSEVVAKRMFGGIGLYFGDAFFGLIDDDVVYLRVDDNSRPEFIARGMSAFHPVHSKPDVITSNYYQVPDDVLDDAEQLTVWARRAVRAALAASRKRTRRTPSSS